MPRDLFGPVTRPFDGVGGRSRLTVSASLLAHVVTVAAVIVVPLVASDALPALYAPLSVSMVTPVVPAAPPLKRLAPTPATEVAPANPDAAPLDVPDGITREPDWQTDTSVAASDGPGIVDGIDSSLALVPPPPPPPPAPRPTAVRVSSGITAPTKIQDVAPVYPAIAQAARVEGLVIIEATIGVDGQVVNARVLRSVPLLDQAALQAVRQWRYTPTRLDGSPVAVIMTVTVNFQLR
jgi:protein TonB